MTISAALTRAAKKQGWSVTRVAAEAGVTEGAARQWMQGRTVPTGDKLLTLFSRLPGFQKMLLSEKAVA